MNPAYTESREEIRPPDGFGIAKRSATLPAKGACWYCDKPVDNVRRFCSLSCRDDYFEEESETLD